jgi:acyl-CoA hydrolase
MRKPAAKPASESLVEMTNLVLPSHTNALGTIFGGVIMSWIDVTAAICAGRHARKSVVTASVDALHFLNPAKLGHVVILKGRVIFTGKTSLVVRVDAVTEDALTGIQNQCVTADLSFVALDKAGKPSAVPPLQIKNRTEQKIYDFAAQRRKVLLEQLKALKNT